MKKINLKSKETMKKNINVLFVVLMFSTLVFTCVSCSNDDSVNEDSSEIPVEIDDTDFVPTDWTTD